MSIGLRISLTTALLVIISVACAGPPEARPSDAKISHDDELIREALRAASRDGVLTDDVIAVLIAHLGDDQFTLVSGTLMTHATPVTAALSRHPESRLKLHDAAMNATDPSIRRGAIFTLGEMRDASFVHGFQQIIATALRRQSERNEDSASGTRSILAAAVDAYAKVEVRHEFEWLLSLSRKDDPRVRRGAYESMSRLAATTEGPPRCTGAEMASKECGILWAEWWSSRQSRSDEELFGAKIRGTRSGSSGS